MAEYTLQLPAKVDARLRTLAAREGRSPAEVAVEVLDKGLPGLPATLPPEEWVRDFRAWVGSLPRIEVVVDDSRESIYEGRGE